jgi:hypothetical protein
VPFDSSGSFQRVIPGGWKADAAAGIKITAVRHDSEDDGFAQGLSTCITKDGRTQPTANLPMNGKKLTNVGEPSAPQDGATKNYVDTFKSFTTGAIITGADVNGRISFTSPSGTNGFSWTGADLSWLAKLATAAGPGSPPVPPATLNRLVLNDKPDGTGTDVVAINDDGSATFNGAVTSGTHTANNAVVVTGANATVQIKPASGNGVLYFFANDGTTARGYLYTSADSVANMTLVCNGQIFQFTTAGEFYSPQAVHAGAAYMDTGGNIVGNIWTNWGAGDAYSAIGARIEARATAWANDRVANLQYRKVSLGYNGTSGGFSNLGAGTVICGYNRDAGNTGQVAGLYYMTLQVYDPVRGWVGFTG